MNKLRKALIVAGLIIFGVVIILFLLTKDLQLNVAVSRTLLAIAGVSFYIAAAMILPLGKIKEMPDGLKKMIVVAGMSLLMICLAFIAMYFLIYIYALTRNYG